MAADLVAASGLFLLILILLDMFLTVFNYDGFTFIAGRFQRISWRVLRAMTKAAPLRIRHALLSFGSASMVPATVLMWLAGEISRFALIYEGGMWPSIGT